MVAVKPGRGAGVIKKRDILMAEQLTIASEQQILMMVGNLEQESEVMVKWKKR